MYQPRIHNLPHIVPKERKSRNSSTGLGFQSSTCSFSPMNVFYLALHFCDPPVMVLVDTVKNVGSGLLTKKCINYE